VIGRGIKAGLEIPSSASLGRRTFARGVLPAERMSCVAGELTLLTPRLGDEFGGVAGRAEIKLGGLPLAGDTGIREGPICTLTEERFVSGE
jgi:hypothetical protein